MAAPMKVLFSFRKKSFGGVIGGFQLIRRNLSSFRDVKKFYKSATITQAEGEYEINLDKRKVKTPSGRVLRVPSEPMALAVATEWNSQQEYIKPHSMYLTSLCNTAIDNPTHRSVDELILAIIHYLHTDTICYRVTEPESLIEMQHKQWDPVLNWFNERYNVNIEPTTSMQSPHVPQTTIDTLHNHLSSYSHWALHGFNSAVETLKSLILTMAIADKTISVDTGLQLSRLETNFQYSTSLSVIVMDPTCTDEFRFRQELYNLHKSRPKSTLLTSSEYAVLLDEVRCAQNAKPKTSHQYHITKKYEILTCGMIDKLIRRRKTEEETPVYFVTIEETYDILKKTHIATGHGGRDKMSIHLADKYDNITTPVIVLYKSLCVECVRKRKRPTVKGTVVKPILSSNFGSRGQVDLIDMQAMPNNSYKWIMVYQDHLTKFCVLRPLMSKRASEVAFRLLDIFLFIGAPEILHSDNGSEFTASVIHDLNEMWPDLVLVHGKPRHPESQGSVERANSDVKDMLIAWLGDNDTNDWTIGLKFVQFQKNSSHHTGIKQSPYQALFGMKAKVGLTTSSLPTEILSRLQSEDDLIAVVSPIYPPTSRTTTVDIVEMEMRPEEASPIEDTSADAADSRITAPVLDAPMTQTSPIEDPPADSADSRITAPPENDVPITSQTDSEFVVSSNVPIPAQMNIDITSNIPVANSNNDITNLIASIGHQTNTNNDTDTNVVAEILLSLNESVSQCPQEDLDAAIVESVVTPDIIKSPLTSRTEHISNNRKRAAEAQIHQAERMVKRSRKTFVPGNINENVTIPIPLVDRGRGDPRNIMGLIVDRDENDMLQ